MSLDKSLTPTRPAFLAATASSLSAASLASLVVFAMSRKIKRSTPGSMSPVRVPLMMPPVGVRPIEVSRQTPLRMAEIDAPLPRCAAISFSGTFGCSW
jgi:hypothetical protein